MSKKPAIFERFTRNDFEKFRQNRLKRREREKFLIKKIERTPESDEYWQLVNELEQLHLTGDEEHQLYIQLKRAREVCPVVVTSKTGGADVGQYVQLRNAGLSHNLIYFYLGCSNSHLYALSRTEYYKQHFKEEQHKENKIKLETMGAL